MKVENLRDHAVSTGLYVLAAASACSLGVILATKNTDNTVYGETQSSTTTLNVSPQLLPQGSETILQQAHASTIQKRPDNGGVELILAGGAFIGVVAAGAAKSIEDAEYAKALECPIRKV